MTYTGIWKQTYWNSFQELGLKNLNATSLFQSKMIGLQFNPYPMTGKESADNVSNLPAALIANILLRVGRRQPLPMAFCDFWLTVVQPRDCSLFAMRLL